MDMVLSWVVLGMTGTADLVVGLRGHPGDLGLSSVGDGKTLERYMPFHPV